MINIKNLNKFNNNDKGVSPVIGVILMVAATIVIAGVIMAMLGGFAPPEVHRSVAIAVTNHNATNISLVFHGGPDGALVDRLVTSINDGPHRTVMDPEGAIPLGNRTFLTVTHHNVTSGFGNDRVVVIAVFIGGAEQIIFDDMI